MVWTILSLWFCGEFVNVFIVVFEDFSPRLEQRSFESRKKPIPSKSNYFFTYNF